MRPAGVSSGFLGLLVAPYLVIAAAVGAVRPSLLLPHHVPLGALFVAAMVVPLLVFLEYLLQALAVLRSRGRFPRAVTVTPFWRGQLSVLDHGLMLLIVVGEELLYRQVCFETLRGALGFPVPAALAVSAVLYGLNHLYFGPATVISKTAAGAVYGALYVLGGDSVWLPILAHGLQNVAVLALAGRRDE